jgi:hypothetical protein
VEDETAFVDEEVEGVEEMRELSCDVNSSELDSGISLFCFLVGLCPYRFGSCGIFDFNRDSVVASSLLSPRVRTVRGTAIEITNMQRRR